MSKEHTEPQVSRPRMPKGYLPADAEHKPLAWSWVRERIAAATNYWIATTTPDGRPHARPVWGVWLDDTLLFSTGSRIATNLSTRNDVSVNLESGDEAIIIEGGAELVRDAPLLRRFAAAYNPKYQWDMTPNSPGAVYVVRPRTVFTWLSDGSGWDGGAAFGRSATRWTFGE